MTRCDLKTYRECACPSGTCQQQPPLITPSKSFTAELIAFWVVIALIVGGTVHVLRVQEHQHQIDARI